MGASASICSDDEFIDIHAAVIDESNQLRTNAPIQLSQSGSDEELENISSSFPKHGVKLRHYDEFIQLCGGRNRLKGLTTTDVCDQFIKPMTMHIQGSYCDLLTQQNHPAVGTARVFISHAWKYKFLDVMDALLYHFRHDTSIIIWFDLFSNNQHFTMDYDFSWWSNTFKSAIAEFGHTVMVFAPWNDPIPLSRAWCLFELYCTIQNSCKFDIAMSKEQTRQFFEDMALHGREKVNTMFASIKLENSECYKREDQEKILQVVRETVGFEKVNQMIFDRFRAWVIKTTIGEIRHALEDVGAIRERKHRVIRLKHTIADLYAGQGKQAEAEPMYEECVSLCRRYFGDCHHETLSQMYQLIHFYVNNGNVAKAFPIVMEFLLIGEGVLGGSHEMIYEAYKLKASLSSQVEEDLTRVEGVYREVIAHMQKHFGDIHRHTLEAIYECGKFCIERIFPHLLSSTPSLSITSGLSSVGFMARRPSIDLSATMSSSTPAATDQHGAVFPIYDSLLLDKRFPEIERMLVTNMQQCRQSLQPEDTLLLHTIHLLTQLYIMQGKYLQAEKVYLEQCKWYDGHLDHPKHLVPQPKSNLQQQQSTQQLKYQQQETIHLSVNIPSHVHTHVQKTHPHIFDCFHKLLPIYLSTKQYITYEYYLRSLHHRESLAYGTTHEITIQTKQLLDTYLQNPKILFDSSDIWNTEYLESYKPCILDDPTAAFSATTSTSFYMTNPITSSLNATSGGLQLSSSPNSVTWLNSTTIASSPPAISRLDDPSGQTAVPSPSRSGKRSFTFSSITTGNNSSVQHANVNLIADIYEKRRKLFGKTHPDTLYALGQLAFANTMLYCPPIQSTSPANNAPILASLSSSMKQTNANATAQLKVVEGLWKDCYEKKKANSSACILFPDTKALLGTYETLHDYAVFLHLQLHKYTVAKAYYEECLPHFLSLHGAQHASTCILYQNLGNICMQLELYKEAKEYYLACLQGKKDACANGDISTKHPKVIQAYFAVILVHLKCHEYESAEQIILEALMIFHNDHLHIPIMNGVRNLPISTPTNTSNNLSLASSSLSPERRTTGSSSKKHHPPSSPSKNNHTNTHNNNKAARSTLSVEEDAERINLFPKARLILYLGNIYVYQGKYRPAEKMLKESIPYVEKYLGYIHADVLESRENLRLIRRMKHDPTYTISHAHHHG
jgi:tetratricopeptide (TPR) repeat protein